MKEKTKSPIKDRPLRYPAQSADEAIDDLLNDKVFMYYIVIILSAILIAYDWWKFYSPATQPPILTTIVLVLFMTKKSPMKDGLS